MKDFIVSSVVAGSSVGVAEDVVAGVFFLAFALLVDVVVEDLAAVAEDVVAAALFLPFPSMEEVVVTVVVEGVAEDEIVDAVLADKGK